MVELSATQLERLPASLLREALSLSTTWSEVEDRVRGALRVLAWWDGIPYPGGPMMLSELVGASYEEKARTFKKYGPGGRFEWPAEWNRGALG